MSDSSESDDGSTNWSRRRGKKKREKIVMRIEFDDSDETSECGTDSSDEDPVRPCSSTRRNRGGKRLFSSDEDRNDTSSGSEIARTVIVRGRRMKKAVIVEEEQPDEACTSAAVGNDSSTSDKQRAEEGFASDSSNDDTLEKCPICLLSLRDQEVGNPSICDHQFCVICIEEWAKNVTTCPIDRRAFDSIIVHESFSNRKFVRKINITPHKDSETAEIIEESATFCQVCNQSNREDVMLLCDGCNQGYHMDCLNPPLLEIPEGFWYCDCCFESEDEDVQEDLNLLYEDLREMGVPETRLRIREVRQPRIPRTRQSERIRASIMARTRTSTTRRFAEMENSQPVSNSRVTTTTRTSTTTARMSTTTTKRGNKKRRKRRSQRQRRTYVVEYDVDNFDEKFEIKTTKKIIRKRKSSKRTGRRRRRKTASTAKISSRRQTSKISDFIALRGAQASSSEIVRPSFSLFGNPNTLEYFTDESDSSLQTGENNETGLGSGGGASVQTSIRIHGFGSGSSLKRRKGLIRDLDRPRQIDVLSSIMDLQDRFHNATRQNHIASVRIGPDGALNLPEKVTTSTKPTKSNTGTGNGSINLPGKEDTSNKPVKSDTAGEKQVPPECINQAPMYPRGGNQNYSNSGSYNNRFNSQSNYRNSTGSGGSGGQFRGNSSSTGGGSGAGGFLFNAFRRDSSSFQSDNSFQPAHINNSDNSSPNLRGRFRPNQNQTQRRNFGRFSGPPSLLNNENLNRSLNETFSSSFNNSNININPSTSSGLQPPPQFTPAKVSDSATLLGLPPTSNLRSYSAPINNSNLISVTLQPPPELPPAYGPSNLPMYGPPNLPVYGPDLITVPILPSTELPVYGPVNYSGPDPPQQNSEEPQIAASSIPMPPLAPPLAPPPPWNKNLFRLTSDYGDDDDDDDCPNFSVYSAESFQVARSTENMDELSAPATGTQKQTSDSEKALQQEDEFEEREEDLVQLGDDDDEIPDAIDEGTKNKEPTESEIYEPDNPTEEPEPSDSNDREDGDDDIEESHTPEQREERTCNEEDDEENRIDHSEHVSQIESAEKVENDDEEDEDSEATQDKKIGKGKKSSRIKKGVLELYDDSDWEEWNIEKTELIPMPPDPPKDEEESPEKQGSETPDDEEIRTPELVQKKQTDSLSEEDEEERSYTPCLDEKTEHDEVNNESAQRAKSKSKSADRDKAEDDRADVCKAVIDGIETELISDEDAEILNEDQNKAGGSSTKRDDKGKNESGGRRRKEQFKKISKSTKERNYRDKDNRVRSRKRTKSRSRSRSRSNDKENQHGRRNNRRRNNKRKDIERYDVRNVIGQPRTFKDRYGRDTSRPARSKSKSRTPPRRPRTKSRTRSVSSKNNRRSFSMSPTPVSIGRPSPKRRMFSPRRSRSRRRSRSIRRSPILRRRTRTPLRLRSRSHSGVRQNGRRIQRFRRRSLSRSLSRSRTPRVPTPRKSRSTSFSRQRNKKRLKDRKKKRIKKRQASASPSLPPPVKRIQRSTDRLGGVRKKKLRPRAKTPLLERTWSHSPEPAVVPLGNESSWTPPLIGTNSNNLTVILKNKELAAANKRKREKKKRNEQRRREGIRKEKRKRRSENRESPLAPSKEVFASGDNILVSVSFNKDGNMGGQQQTTVVTLPPTREEIVSKRRSPERPGKKQKKSKEKAQRRHKKTDAKPVAIIDLERSPFQVIAQSPRDIIILTDSDREEEEDDINKRNTININNEVQPVEHMANDMQLDSIDKSPDVERPETMEEESFEMQQLGPKTPPEPPTIKFLLAKSKQVKARNPLHEEQEELENEQIEEENDAESDIQAANKIGPNTPPESGPCSPDAYDPFDPTKSPSASPSHSPPQQDDMPADTCEKESTVIENNTVEARTTTITQEKNMNPVELVMALMTSKTNKSSQEMLNLNSESASYNIPSKSDACESLDISDENITGVPKNITVLSNVLIAPGKSQQRSAPILSTSPPISKSQSQSLAKLPMPKLIASNRQNGGTGGSSEDIGGGMIEIESPYSPGADDYEDLFEPPIDNIISLSQLARNHRAAKTKKAEIFDNLFGSTSPATRNPNYPRKKGANKITSKKTSVKVTKTKLDDDQIKIFDEFPSSAVELQVKDKFLRKLNRQERVVEEVKLVLKPHYNRKRITKDDYKDILRRAVPKICHSRSGEINPNKIKKLIEAYVRKFRQRNKFGIIGTRQVSSASKCADYLNKL